MKEHDILMLPTGAVVRPEEESAPSALERLEYLCPSRYFRFYMLFERTTKSSCWLPEGYDF